MIYELQFCRDLAKSSKDPSSKIGAMVLDCKGNIVGKAWNRFPAGIKEDARMSNRDEKYALIVHAEIGALLQAGSRSKGGTIYVYAFKGFPCPECTKHIIAAGIKKIVITGPELPKRWKSTQGLSQQMIEESGITCDIVEAND